MEKKNPSSVVVLIPRSHANSLKQDISALASYHPRNNFTAIIFLNQKKRFMSVYQK